MLVVVHYLHVKWAAFSPAETDSPLLVYPNAVVSPSVSNQALQPVAAEGGKVSERLCVIKDGQPARRLNCKAPKLPNILALKELKGVPVPESCYHCYALRKGYKAQEALSTPPHKHRNPTLVLLDGDSTEAMPGLGCDPTRPGRRRPARRRGRSCGRAGRRRRARSPWLGRGRPAP